MKSGIHPSPSYTASLTFQAVSQREESTAPTGDGRKASVRGTHAGEPDPFCPHSPGNTAQLRADSSGGRNVPDICEYAC